MGASHKTLHRHHWITCITNKQFHFGVFLLRPAEKSSRRWQFWFAIAPRRIKRVSKKLAMFNNCSRFDVQNAIVNIVINASWCAKYLLCHFTFSQLFTVVHHPRVLSLLKPFNQSLQTFRIHNKQQTEHRDTPPGWTRGQRHTKITASENIETIKRHNLNSHNKISYFISAFIFFYFSQATKNPQTRGNEGWEGGSEGRANLIQHHELPIIKRLSKHTVAFFFLFSSHVRCRLSSEKK